MDAAQFGQFCEVDFEQFLSKSSQIHCKVIGTIISITKHKKYIIEVYLNKKAVIRSYKRYSSFQALYELLQEKYKDYKIEEFPSKYQIFGKEQTRKSYFQNLLNQIIKDYSKQDIHVTRQLLEHVYNFLGKHINQQKLHRERISNKKQKMIKDRQNFILDQTPQAKEQSSSEIKFQKNLNIKGSNQKERRQSADITYPTIQIVRTRSNSATEISLNNINSEFVTEPLQPDNQFELKFAHEDGWKDGFIEIKESCLYLYKNRMDHHFKTQIQLYRIKVQYLKRKPNLFDQVCEKLECNLTRTFNQNQEVLSLYHQYDKSKILIRRPVRQDSNRLKDQLSLSKLKQAIEEASHINPKVQNYDGVFNPIGKLFVFLHKASFNWRKYSQKDTILIKIMAGATHYFSMPVAYGQDSQINQGFLIPISDVFQRIRIQCYVGKGQKDKGTLIGVFKFSMIQFFTKPDRSLIDKLQVTLLPSQKFQQNQTKIQISLENLSDITSIYSNSYLSQFDGFPLKPINSLDDIQDFQIAIERILNIIGNFKLLGAAFKRNCIKFKYPIMGYLFFSFLLFNAIFLDASYIIRQLILIIILCIAYQQKHVYLLVNFILNKYVFSQIHPKFRNPQVLGTGEIGDLKWAHLLKYISEDYQYVDGKLVKNNTKRDSYQFIVHGRMFIVREDQQSFFQKIKKGLKIIQSVYQIVNTVAFSLQKVGSLFSWVDIRKTLIVTMALLIATGIATGNLIRIIISIVCIVKMIKGPSYYRNKHYNHNRKVAIYALRYIMQKSFPNIIGNKNIHKNMDLFELNQYISDLKFPINDDSSMKKLRADMKQIFGVYLQVDSIYPKALKQGQIRMVHLIDMIQTCETKLEVNFVPGQQGVSDDYQQLKQQTKDVEDLDDLFKENFKNFILNIPSRLFMIYHKKQLNKIEKAEIKQKQAQTGKEVQPVRKVVIRSPQSIEAMQIQRRKAQIEQKAGQNKFLLDQKVQKQEVVKQKIVLLKQASQQ